MPTNKFCATFNRTAKAREEKPGKVRKHNNVRKRTPYNTIQVNTSP